MCKANISLRVKENRFKWDWEQWKWLLSRRSPQPNDMMLCNVISVFPVSFSQFENNNFRNVTYRSRSDQTGKNLCTSSSVRRCPRCLPMQTSCWMLCINAVVAYGGWVPRNMGDWNCWPQTQTEYPIARPTCNPATSPARHAERTSGMAQPGAMGARGQRHTPQGIQLEAPNLT